MTEFIKYKSRNAQTIFFCVFLLLFSNSKNAYSQSWNSISNKRSDFIICSYYDSATSFTYLGGEFDTLFGVPAKNIIVFDGTNWLPVGNGVNGPVADIVKYNGELIAGGYFDSSGVNKLNGPIAKFKNGNWINLDTISIFDDPFMSPLNIGSITKLCIHNNKLFIMGLYIIYPNINNTFMYGELSYYDGVNVSPALVNGASVSVIGAFSRGLTSFKGDLYIGVESSSVDTCLSSNYTVVSGLLRLDTICNTIHQVGNFNFLFSINDLYSTDSLLYIASTANQPLTGHYFTTFDGVNFGTLGDGFNGPTTTINELDGMITVFGPFTNTYSGLQSLDYIAQWDGSNWIPFNVNCNLNNIVYNACHAFQNIISSGPFDSCGGVQVGRSVSYPNNLPTGIAELSFSKTNVSFLVVDGVGYFYSNNNKILNPLEIRMYNLLGKQLNFINGNSIFINSLNIKLGLYVIVAFDKKTKETYRVKYFHQG